VEVEIGRFRGNEVSDALALAKQRQPASASVFCTVVLVNQVN
jgi:hypothetical protein